MKLNEWLKEAHTENAALQAELERDSSHWRKCFEEMQEKFLDECTAKGALQAELIKARRKENLQAHEGRPALQAEIEEIARRAVTAELMEAQKENLQLRMVNQAMAAELIEARKNNLHLSWVVNQATIMGAAITAGLVEAGLIEARAGGGHAELEAMQKERRAVRQRKRGEERRHGGQKTMSEPESSECVPESESVPWDSVSPELRSILCELQDASHSQCSVSPSSTSPLLLPTSGLIKHARTYTCSSLPLCLF